MTVHRIFVRGGAFGSLTTLRLPGDDVVAIELVYDPARGRVDLGTGTGTGTGILVNQVESLDVTLADLAARGLWPSRPGLPTAGGGRGPVGS